MRRVVTSYMLHKAASGRLSSGVDSEADAGKLRGKVTQVQNIPKGVRDIIVAGKGFKLIQGDYAAIEWCLMMWGASKIAKDTFHLNILNEFQEGRFDPHRYLAAIANNVAECDVTYDMRSEAKPWTHGKNYLGGNRTLAYKAGQTTEVGEKLGTAHEKAFRVGPYQQYVIAQCKKRNYIQTPLGWRRYFWGWDPKPTEVIATLVQGTAGDLCKVVLGTIFATLPEGWEVYTTTHDSFLLRVPDYHVATGEAFLRTRMQAPIDWLDGRTWRCDIKVGDTWKDVS